MAVTAWGELELLFLWCDSITYTKSKGSDSSLVLVFNHTSTYYAWRDFLGDVSLPYDYTRDMLGAVTVTVPVIGFFRHVAKSKKWRVSNLR